MIINAIETLKSAAESANDKLEEKMIRELIEVLTSSEEEIAKKVSSFVKKYVSVIGVGCECVFRGKDCDEEENRFIITKLYGECDEAGDYMLYFDGIYPDGRTINCESTSEVVKTGRNFSLNFFSSSLEPKLETNPTEPSRTKQYSETKYIKEQLEAFLHATENSGNLKDKAASDAFKKALDIVENAPSAQVEIEPVPTTDWVSPERLEAWYKAWADYCNA